MFWSEIEQSIKAHSGVAAMLYLPADVAKRLAVKGGEKAEDLHLTLAFMGDTAEIGKDALAKAQQACEGVCSKAKPVAGRISGLGRFNASKNSDGKDVLYASVDSPALTELRQEMVKALEGAGVPANTEHGFMPHVTLAYVDPDAEAPIAKLADIDVTFDSLTLAIGDQHHVMPLGAASRKKEIPMDTLTDIKELSHEDLHSAIHAALNPPRDMNMAMPMMAETPYRWLKAVYKDRVIVEVTGPGHACHLYEISYSVNSKDEVTLGEPVEVEMVYQPKAGMKERDADDSKAEWSTAMMNDLPDSAFLYVESGDKDEEGKTTPRSKRHFPYKDANGKVDLPHLRNAIARIPQSNAPGLDEAKKNSLQERARKLLASAQGEGGQKEGKRMMSRMREKLKAMLDAMQDVMKWANYEDGEHEDMDDSGKALLPDFAGHAQSFKVYRDKADAARWVSWTTNGFADKEAEIFTTKSLEEEVSRSDKEWPAENRQLWFWHVPGSDFGQADWRGVVGRILVESGTFDKTPRGEKALAYFLAHSEEDLKMSHGYRYRKDDRADGVYEWLEIVERSVLPGAAAANPWTQFSAKEVNMPLDETKRKALENVFGADEAAAIIAAAEQKTKELEDRGVAFKEGSEGAPAQKDSPAVDVKALAEAFASSPLMVELAASNKAIGEQLTGLSTTQKATDTRLTALEARLAKVEVGHAESVKAAVLDLPRMAFYRPTQDAKTVVDPESEEGKKLLEANAGPVDQNPNYPLNRPINQVPR
jgi:2'-5' RNA ligase